MSEIGIDKFEKGEELQDDFVKISVLRLQKLENSINRIELALVGNPPMGQKGIVQRLEALEDRVEKHDKKLILWGGVITGILFVIQILPKLLKGFLGGG
jgi:hypothetical protein